MKKGWVGALAILLLFIASLGGAAMYVTLNPEPIKIFMHHDITLVTGSGEHRIDAELAISVNEQAQGLMYRKTVPENTGMLFLFQHNGTVDMWMKNTLVPLDMLFIDEHGTVIGIAPNSTPGSAHIISSPIDTRAALELAAGSVERLHIAKGDKVIYAYFHP